MDEEDFYFSPIVKPDLRTLRLIVRAAMIEQKRWRRTKDDVGQQRSVLRWARQFYRAFGCGKKTIEQEVPQAHADHQGDSVSPAEAKALYDRERQLTGVRERASVKVGRLFRRIHATGSPRWVPTFPK